MLAIRMQRTGRKGHAQYRVVVQDSRLTPTSGRVVARLGAYNPHTKSAELDSKKAEFYLGNGAQPSDRVARLFQKEGIKLPYWVSIAAPQKRTVRNPEKLRKNQPQEQPSEEPKEDPEQDPKVDKPEEPAEAATKATADTDAEADSETEVKAETK